MTGVALGLLAAASWGLTDSLAALSSRRLGTVPSAALSLLISVVVLGAGVLATGPELGSPRLLLWVAAFGVIATASSLMLWQALRLAPLSVISPINATAGVVVVALAMVMLGERPAPIQLLALPFAAVGSSLAALVPGHGDGRPALVGGAILAFGAVVGFALISVGLRDPVREVGWLPVAFVSRTTNATLTWLILLAALALPSIRARRGGRPMAAPLAVGDPLMAPPVARLREASLLRLAVLVLALGLADVAGLIFYAAGLELAPAWLIGLLASIGPVLAVGVGLVIFRERLRAHQWLGVALVVVALVLVAVGEASASSTPP